MLELAATQVWVRDQEEAIAVWVDKGGFEIKEDGTVPKLGNFGWVTVGPGGQDGTACTDGHFRGGTRGQLARGSVDWILRCLPVEVR